MATIAGQSRFNEIIKNPSVNSVVAQREQRSYTELRHKVTFYTGVKMLLCAAAEYTNRHRAVDGHGWQKHCAVQGNGVPEAKLTLKEIPWLMVCKQS